MAYGVSSDDGDRRTDDTSVAVCVQRIRMDIRILLLDGDGCCHLLFILSHV